MKVTRRQLASALVAAGAASAQAPTQSEPAADDLSIQRDSVRKNAEALRDFKIEETLEPSFVFKPE